ncbi:MAG: flagellar hook-length control protein FliK [Planctomycetes bacterium]|nr:flagellar hook-length control protein FliK [Planctomycetota bacterium]
MDPLSNSIISALRLNVLAAATPVLPLQLQNGMVVSGEVLSTSAGIAYLSMGGRRVPAETAVELRAGQKFTALVEADGDNFILRILQGAPEEERALASALRTVLAEDRPTGALVSRLTAELAAQAEKLPPKERERVLTLLKEIERFVLAPGAEGEAPAARLMSALAKSGLFHEALIRHGGPQELGHARGDLKSLLLRAIQIAPEGAERDSLLRALAGIEAEQLLDIARSRSGDARQIGIPMYDGREMATAHFVVHPDAGRGGEAPEEQREKRVAVDLAVSFSNLGPVRAEFRAEGDRLAVRFVVSSPEIAERLQADSALLAERMAASGTPTVMHVVTAPAQSIVAESELDHVSFLRDHSLLDLRG